MAALHSIHHIEKLHETNYESWKLQMKSVLICNELWAYVNGKITPTPENLDVWNNKDEKALASTLLSVSKNQLLHIKKAETSAVAWGLLQDTNESKEQLEEAGINIPDELLSIMLLNSLPTEYEAFCITIESRDDIPSVESLKLKLIEQEARRDDQVTKESIPNNDALFVKGKPNEHNDHRGNTRGRSSRYKSTKYSGDCFKGGK
ncbi:hypothetical protein WN55_06998 [Dufourea novaeangliae]|uniref:DUF4219 domain-containing protein n=1 Tax=Dufourea novaeangliae TaxID=178035 RepID=A0A154PR72_DUFNO|nr:hypothetical protein WN55_06998 [Dufourea novaeangliae]